eukprot:jgi/Ulvmu1/11173/UM072_0009.1
MFSRTRLLQAFGLLSVVTAAQIVFASITTSKVRHFSMTWQHQEAVVAGSNTLTTILAVLYTVMASGVLTGLFEGCLRNLDMWLLSVSTSSMWMGAMFAQSAMVNHGYVGQALISEALREWSAEATGCLRASYILGDVLGLAYVVFGAVLLFSMPGLQSGNNTYEPIHGTA